MMRIFDNPHVLPKRIILLRLSDNNADVILYVHRVLEEETDVHYVIVDSALQTSQIESFLSTPLTVDELNYIEEFSVSRQALKEEYLGTISTLQQIEDTTSPTHAQVIAAVKFIAKTVRLMLKILAKMYQ